MERLVIDSSILAASFLGSDQFHQASLIYIGGLENGDFTFDIPFLAVVEVLSAVSTQVQTNRLDILARVQDSLREWERTGKIVLHELNRQRMENVLIVAPRDRLRGSDSVIAALAEEIGLPLKTFDTEVLDRFPLAAR